MNLNKKNIALIIIGAILIYVLFFIFSVNRSYQEPDAHIINDVSRLNPTRIEKIVQNDTVEGIQQALAEAKEKNLQVSIAGRRHSMGGHTFYEDALVLDMTSFDEILKIDEDKKTITVESGATWDQVIDAIDPYGLSVSIMQAYSGFTVGGSMSVNVHQSDPRFGPMVESIRSFRLLMADGTIRNVSRNENEELFSLVIGGYGLFGVILDATLDLIDNNVYKKNEFVISYTDYLETFDTITKDELVEVVFARLNFIPGRDLLDEVIVTTYGVTDETTPEAVTLVPDKNVWLKKLAFALSRKYTWGKKLRYYVQEKQSDLADPDLASRNNLDKRDVAFLDYYSTRDTDILQEYFIPVETLPAFIDELRATIQEHDINLLSATIRYVPANDEVLLSYAGKDNDRFGVVLYFNVGLSDNDQEEVTTWTRRLIDKAIDLNGTFYLPYELYATGTQIRQAYPTLDEFFAKKKQYDPNELFMNEFYETYAYERL